MEEADFQAVKTADVVAAFLKQSCIVLRNFVDAAAFDCTYDMTLRVEVYFLRSTRA